MLIVLDGEPGEGGLLLLEDTGELRTERDHELKRRGFGGWGFCSAGALVGAGMGAATGGFRNSSGVGEEADDVSIVVAGLEDPFVLARFSFDLTKLPRSFPSFGLGGALGSLLDDGRDVDADDDVDCGAASSGFDVSFVGCCSPTTSSGEIDLPAILAFGSVGRLSTVPS